MTIDFTKPLEMIYEGTEPIRAKIVYENQMFVVVETSAGSIWNFMKKSGLLSCRFEDYQKYTLRNVKPKVTSETWVNLYKDGSTGDEYRSRTSADTQKNPYKRFYAYFVTKQYSDGTTTNEIIPISE